MSAGRSRKVWQRSDDDAQGGCMANARSSLEAAVGPLASEGAPLHLWR